MRSFVDDVFIPKYYEKMGLRKDTFMALFKKLETKPNKFFCIVETGAARGGPNDLAGNGSSTYLFDEFVKFYDGIVFSFDVNPLTVQYVNASVSQKTNVVCVDSIQGIESLKLNNIKEIDLLYLDSLDTHFDNDGESANHALNELKSAIPHFKKNTTIFIDDTPKSINMLPPWIMNDKSKGGNPSYMSSLRFPCGKGRKILEFVKQHSDFEVMEHEYQILLNYVKKT